MSLEDQTIDDYAPRPAQKRRISRGRKALIGLMAIGAFAATQGAGTFASFTASTDNASSNAADGDNPFQTGRFELLNTVIDSAGDEVAWATDWSAAGTQARCSSDEDDATEADGLSSAQCDFIFDGVTDDIITVNSGNGIVSYIRLENNGDPDSGDGKLILFADELCTQATGGSDDNCDEVILTIQEYAVDAFPGKGSVVPDFTAGGDDEVAECVWGQTGTLPAVVNADADATTADTDGACKYGRRLSDLPAFGAEITISSLVPALDIATVDSEALSTNNDVRYFKLTAQLPQTGCGAITKPSLKGADDDTAADGFHDTTGTGCLNSVQDTSSKFDLRWMLVQV